MGEIFRTIHEIIHLDYERFSNPFDFKTKKFSSTLSLDRYLGAIPQHEEWKGTNITAPSYHNLKKALNDALQGTRKNNSISFIFITEGEHLLDDIGKDSRIRKICTWKPHTFELKGT